MDKENFGLQITDEDIEWVRTIMPDIESVSYTHLDVYKRQERKWC